MSNPLKDLIESMLTNEQKTELKAHLEKFNTPIVPQAQPIQPVQMMEATLEDGTVIKYDTPVLGVGSVVSVVTPEGELPAPDGTHTLTDGTKIEVAQGVVTSIEVPAPVAPVEPAAPVAPDMSAQFAKVEEKFSKENETLKAEIETLNAKIEDQSKNIEVIYNFFNTLLETPTEKPVEKVKKIDSKINILNKFNSK